MHTQSTLRFCSPLLMRLAWILLELLFVVGFFIVDNRNRATFAMGGSSDLIRK